MSVRRLSERILKFLTNKDFLKEERERARHLSRGIEGFGSFSQRSSTIDHESERLNDKPCKIYGRYNSCYDNHQHHQEHDDFTSLLGNKREQQIHRNKDTKLLKQENNSSSEDIEDHPFVDQEEFTTASLLSVQ